MDAEQDYYLILGVDPKAGAREIKHAWLKIARREHPDVNPGDREAVARYAVVQEAWRVLSQRALREEYDRRGRRSTPAGAKSASAGAAGVVGGRWEQVIRELFPESAAAATEPAMAPQRGEDIHLVLELSFEEALRGVVREFHYRREGACAECRGRRWVPGSPVETCPSCRGRGVVEVPHGPWTVRKLCPTCDGEGESGEEPCRVCRGRGHVAVAEKRAVRVAAGSPSGSRIVVAAAGQPGRRGGEPGDLVVTLKVQPHALLERRGHNLYVSIPVTLPQAVLGGPVPVPTAEGRKTLRLPPGTQGGQVFVLRGKGVPAPGGGARGDLHVTVTVTLPSGDDPRVRRAMLELEKALLAPPRATP
ncbi:MAG: DnaJ C-terminal domain-containing protein [Candidatus Methylomirabilia bacterium]